MDSFTLPPNLPDEISQLITQLIMRIEKLESVNEAHVKKITELEATNAALTIKVTELEAELLLAKNSKKSMTSSTPPSADLARSNTRNLRVKTGRQKGGQPGHKGHTLTFSDVVNETIMYPPSETICKRCGTSLKNTQTYIKSRKQVHDIPPVIINVTEHQKIACDCPNCGRTHEGEFPKEIKGNVQYGKNLNAIVAYLSTYHYLPISRLSRLLSDLLGAKISQGTIVNILKDMATKAEITLYEEIKREIANANCIGADETGIKINGERGWFFVFQTPTATFIKSSLKRDFDTIEQAFSGGFPESIYVTDCLPAQLKVNAKGHQLCIAHLLRETENFIQSLKCPWSDNVQTFFYILLEEKTKLQEQQAVIPIERYEKIKEIFHKVLLQAVPLGSHSKVLAFARRLIKNLDSIFQFLLYHDVPPDNNASERAIRNAKVKIKISGFFSSIDGAQCYAVLRSVIDSSLKKGLSVLETLANIAILPSPVKTAE